VLRPQQSRCDIGAFEQTFLSVLTLLNGNVRVEYAGVPGASYQLQVSYDLDVWADVEGKPADANGQLVFDGPGDLPTSFFRIGLR
jgi:hypothetical protein